jgi:hypothetical protein
MKQVFPHAKAMRPYMLACAWQTGVSLLQLSAVQSDYVTPKDLQDLPFYEDQIMETAKTASIHSLPLESRSLVHIRRFEDVLWALRKFGLRDWHSLDPPSLLHIWSFFSQGTQYTQSRLRQLGEIMPDQLGQAHRPKAVSRVTKVWSLHTVLQSCSHKAINDGDTEGAKRDLAADDPLYRALKFLHSKSVLALSQKETLTEEEVQQLSATCLKQISTLLYSGYPMDRQIIATILHLHHVGDASLRARMHKQSVLLEAWRQWAADRTLRSLDLILLVGFLRAVPPADTRREDSSWANEATAAATTALGLSPEEVVDGNATSTEPRFATADTHPMSATLVDASNKSVKSDLLRALAIASLRSDRIDTALDCLHDTRLVFRHAIIVLNELASYLGPQSTVPVPERKQLIAICANYAAKSAPQIRTYIERGRVQLLAPFIELLAYHLHLEEAAALVLALKNPAHLGEETLSEFLRKLSFHRQGVLALAIYSKIPPFDVTDYHRAALLSSPWKGLSDVVWEQLFEDGKKKQLDVRLLNARLLHYANQPEKTTVSSRRILLDHSDAINVLGVEPTTDTDNILFGVLIKAGRLRHAYDVYERLRKAASAHTSTILNRFLVAAPKPRADWRHIGPVAQHNKIVKALKQMTEEHDMPMNGATANILLRANLKWGEMSGDAVWAALKAGLENAEKRDWATELRPLFRMVVGFFIKRNMKEDARKAVSMMVEMRMSRIGR